MSNYAVIDLETSIKNRGENAIGKNKASPFHKGNKICWVGWSQGEQKGEWKPDGADTIVGIAPHTKLLAGANIKFDLLYMMRDYKDVRDWLKTGKIWDIQLAEYLLTGQDSKWAKLDNMAVKYGGTVKDDRLKEFWEANIDTEDIDDDIIQPYLKGDVENTEIVFKAQVALAQEMDMMPLMWEQMDALLATTEMEFNGMHFEKAQCLIDSVDIAKEVNILRNILNARISDVLRIADSNSNCGSVDQVSLALFGGDVREIIDAPIIDVITGQPERFKSGHKKGEIKTRKESQTRRVQGLMFSPDPTWAVKKAGYYRVNDEVIKELHSRPVTLIQDEFLSSLVRFRKTNKDLKTYYMGYSDLVWPDSRIHPQFNHCATATGRLSHSSPNLGNVSHKKDDD